ncbi:MAG: endonuclease [Sciscionella sp.]
MNQKETVRGLLEACGQSYAAQAGINLTDKPSALYRLLVLSVLLSTRIKADIAVDAARELRKAGFGTARNMLEGSWQQRVDALDRAHYRRYDEQTATALGDGARLLVTDYRGDLRKLRERAAREPSGIKKLLSRTPRLGPVGADIFCREAQLVWPELRPYLDKKALDGAEKLGLPTQPQRLAKLVDDDRIAVLAAALVRVSLDPKLAAQVR